MIRDDVYADEEEGFRTVTATPADLQLRKPLHLSNKRELFTLYIIRIGSNLHTKVLKY